MAVPPALVVDQCSVEPFQHSTLLAKVSATIRLPLPPLASTAYGQVSAPPTITELPVEVPFMSNSSRRLFLVSDTHSVPGLPPVPGAKLTSRGQLKPLRSLAPQPRAPHIAPFDQVSPFAPVRNCWMRWLTLSATYRLPLLSNVMPEGSLNDPCGGAPNVAG